MRAIILAAGRGLRLADPLPKCLLRFGGASLLERHLRLLSALGIDDVVLALGYRHDAVEAEIAALGASVEVVLNPRFELGSMLTAHAVADPLTRGGDVLLMDADVLYDDEILERLVAGPSTNRLLIDRDFEPGDEPVKVCLRDSVPVEFRKRIAEGLVYDTIGESVGFFRFDERGSRRFAALVQNHISNGGENLPHEEAIRDLLLEGRHRFDVADATGLPWIEIDFPADVARANDEVLPQIDERKAVLR